MLQGVGAWPIHLIDRSGSRAPKRLSGDQSVLLDIEIELEFDGGSEND
jgi:hypothetical protein